MKFCVVNKSTILNTFVLHILKRNIMHLAVITRKTNILLGILKGGVTGKEPHIQPGKTTRLFHCKNDFPSHPLNLISP